MLAYPVQANALFGSECRDAKSSHKNAMTKYNEASRKWEVARVKFEAEKAKREQDCLRDTKSAIKKYPSSWKLAKPDKKYFCEFIKFSEQKPIMAQSPDITYKRVMEIVVNYKKCFKVEEFLDAKQWLREN
jgi:hypothetical protein